MVIAWLVVAYLTLAEPVLGLLVYRRLRDGSISRSRAYASSIAQAWVLTAAALASLSLAGVPLARLGLRLGDYAPAAGQGVVLGLAAGLVLGAAASLAIVALARRRHAGTPLPPPTRRRVAGAIALLPRTVPERRLFALVAVTAGVCEEILYRAVALYVLSHALPGLPMPALVALAALVFALGHAYQGLAGALGAGGIGAAFAVVYLGTGSLLLPVVLHSVIDLRALAAAPEAAAAPAQGAA